MQPALLEPQRQQVEEVLPVVVVLPQTNLVPRSCDVAHVHLIQQVNPAQFCRRFLVFVVEVPVFQNRLRLQVLVLALRNAARIDLLLLQERLERFVILPPVVAQVTTMRGSPQSSS